MSVSSIASHNSVASGFSVSSASASQASKLNQLRQQFQQLGQHLQSGKLSAAQTDFATLQQASSTSATVSTPGNDPVTQALRQLQTDLQAGNLPGAPAKPAPGAPIAQQGPEAGGAHGHHHHHPVARPEDPTAPGAGAGLDQLGQALQSNNLSAAQQAYNSVLQGLPLSLSGGVATPDVLAQTAGSVSLNA
ncbi:MAG TPA: hypothetical protein VKR60_00135 [Candidatus Sulfotelmatobacter sp.]|nr:hypothetical protein [Candidatus Sulfotelmatobacter sp.]